MTSSVFFGRHAASYRRLIVLCAGALAACTSSQSLAAPSRQPVHEQSERSLWDHDNLVAWCVVPFDSKKRGPQERANMLARLGFKHFAYDWREKDIPTFDEEIRALKENGINLLAWLFPSDAKSPLATETLELFKRHDVHPQLWVVLPPKEDVYPKNTEEWAKLLPKGMSLPRNEEEADRLSESERTKLREAFVDATARFRWRDIPSTPEAQERRLEQETNRIHALVNLVKPYGLKIALYNHNGWFGMMENQVSIIEKLTKRGVSDVGIVYNFSHSRDELHDDTKNFAAVWKMIQPHVVAVNITGVRWEGQIVYPSQGDSELDMMRAIQESGWRGPIGLIAEKGGDAESTLANYLAGIDWLGAELRLPGSGGPRPFASKK